MGRYKRNSLIAIFACPIVASFERLSMKLANTHIGAAVFSGLLLVAVVLNLPKCGSSTTYRPPTSEYFFDLSSRELIAVPFGTLSPMQGSEGRKVAAFVFGCGSCRSNQVAYLSRTTPRMLVLQHQHMETGEYVDDRIDALREADPREGVYVSAGTVGEAWHHESSAEAEQILKMPAETCGGLSKVIQCFP